MSVRTSRSAPRRTGNSSSSYKQEDQTRTIGGVAVTPSEMSKLTHGAPADGHTMRLQKTDMPECSPGRAAGGAYPRRGVR